MHLKIRLGSLKLNLHIYYRQTHHVLEKYEKDVHAISSFQRKQFFFSSHWEVSKFFTPVRE